MPRKDELSQMTDGQTSGCTPGHAQVLDWCQPQCVTGAGQHHRTGTEVRTDVVSRRDGSPCSQYGGLPTRSVLHERQRSEVAAQRGVTVPRSPNTASSVHPLIPLLMYSDKHFLPSSPYDQQISAALSGNHDNPFNRSGVQVKKPLNAFMLYMKEMRHKVLQEGHEKESAAINRILGRRWHSLSYAEQSKYYDLAQKERELHMQLYPGWSAKDNYGKRKRKRSQTFQGSNDEFVSYLRLN